MNTWADENPETLRLSIDTKATVLVGQYSRGRKSRGTQAVEAWDHDMRPREKLVPGGILEPVSGKSFLFFGNNNNKTSDFLVDGLLLWWKERESSLSHIKQLVINIDNGPECSGCRSQFLYRMSEFAERQGLTLD